MSEKLPSYEDFIVNPKNLPSIDDLIIEEKLPSVDDFIEPPRPEEEIADLYNADSADYDFSSVGAGNTAVDTTPCSVEEAQDLTEIIRLISDVRKDIPEIPEIKYYDSELESILEQIKEIPEVRYYDKEIKAVCEQIDNVKEEIKELPEPKYYDDQVASIEDRISNLHEDLVNLPVVKYYDEEITSIREQIDQVRSEIPKFPKWVNEVNEVPDFSWIGKTFSVIDDDFIKVDDKIKSICERMDREVQDISENIETKDFDNRVEINKVSDKLQETKENILKEIKETVIRVWDHHHEFKNDDRLLKKQILSQFNVLKQRVDEEVKQFNLKNKEARDLSKGYFDDLADEISNLPKPKYYDENIRDITKDIKKLNNHHDYNTTNISELYRIVEELKGKQEVLKEELDEQSTILAEPPSTDNEDPLTPIDQNFVTVDQLQKHYKLFVERVQYQLASIGGGGAGFIKDLDDVSFDGSDKQLLIYDSGTQKWVGIASTALLGDISEVSGNLNIAGNITGTAATFTGNVTIGGTITYDDVTFLDSIGVATARSGLDVGAGSITPIISIQASTDTTTTTSASTIDSFVAATFRSAQYQIQITQGSNYHVTTLNVLHDGTDVFLNEFGTIRTGASLASFDADINSGSVRVRATPTTDSSTVFKLTKTLTRV
jgi:prefoldin subunit 5